MAKLGGVSISEPGRYTAHVAVTRTLGGSELTIPVHVVQGDGEGPVLALISTLHGAEWFSVPAMRQLLQRRADARMNGTLVVVPVANPMSFAMQTRSMPDESDHPDLNRIFPGNLTWTSDLLVAALVEQVLSRATHMVDYHPGPWGSTFGYMQVGDDLTKPGLVEEIEALALSAGVGIVKRSPILDAFPGPGSSVAYCGEVLGIVATSIALGGTGFGPEHDERWTRHTVWSMESMMRHLGMIDDGAEPDPGPQRVLVVRHSVRVNPSFGGQLVPAIGPDRLWTEVEPGELLGEVIDIASFETLEQLRAPAKGVLHYVARSSVVHPGDWGFGLGLLDESSRWVERRS